MRRPLLLVAAGLAATALTATGLPASASSASNASQTGQAHKHKRVCTSAPKTGTAACDAEVQVKDDGVTPAASTSPLNSSLTPAQLRGAYKVPDSSRNTTPGTVAIVDAYASPTALADLNMYRGQFGIPAVSTSGSPTFRQVNQTGGGISSVSGDVGWGQEESLDLDMASAICPTCNILYVGANSASFSDLSQAVKEARALGADVISNSYGGNEFYGESSPSYTDPYRPTDTVVTISSGDNGYGVEFPAAVQGPNTLAVGGTSLTLNGTARASETVWSGAGSGCSSYITKPSWQTDSGCRKRTVTDISAVANPNTGVAVYDSFGSDATGNWFQFGGTSVASPIIASDYAASGFRHQTANVTNTLYKTTAKSDGTAPLFDVTSGSNGHCKNSVAYLCTGRTGYDGPTGKGTPNAPLSF